MSMRYKGGVISATAPTTSTSLATGVWTRQQQMQAQGAGLWPITYDPYFKNVSLLLHGDGTNGAQNNTFLDSSTNNFTITRNGNTTQGTASPYGPNWSNYFDAASYLYGPASSAPAVDFAGAHTLEGWFYLNTTPASGTGLSVASASIISTSTGSGNNWKRWLFDGSTSFSFLNRAGTAFITLTMSSSTPINQWFHCAFVMDASTTATVYINGVSVGTATDSTAFSARTTYQVVIGDGTLGGNYGFFNGYMSNLRFSNTARYTANFTPSTTPLTADANTTLLTCQSNRFVDNSSSALALTVGGSGIPGVQRFSPFRPPSAYSTSVIGGSGYFDGSGDYLSIADNAALKMGSSDFTYECWLYPTSIPNAYQSFISKRTAGGYAGVLLALKSTGKYSILVANSSSSWGIVDETTISVTLNTWQHLAVVRSGASFYVYLNGTRLISTSIAFSVYDDTSAQSIGVGDTSAIQPYFGYISDVRIVKGTALYTGATFTLSAVPLTPVTNTQLLLSYTNAGIYDNVMVSDLETTGTAQIRTSVFKYGSGSMYFDGSGSSLVPAPNSGFSFGTGDFTVEFWLNSNDVSSATQKGCLQTSGTAGGLQTTYTSGIAIYQGGNATGGALNGGIVANVAGTWVGSGTASITTGTWYHIALVRSSGVSNLYVNGTSIASVSTAGNCTGTNLIVGAYYNSLYYYNGYMDDLRITKGIARYTANFTPAGPFYDN